MQNIIYDKLFQKPQCEKNLLFQRYFVKSNSHLKYAAVMFSLHYMFERAVKVERSISIHTVFFICIQTPVSERIYFTKDMFESTVYNYTTEAQLHLNPVKKNKTT